MVAGYCYCFPLLFYVTQGLVAAILVFWAITDRSFILGDSLLGGFSEYTSLLGRDSRSIGKD